jgi:S-adenosylmethionine:tRNA ribosyltransferase-isomerase
MFVHDFDFDLPADLIAQEPAADREDARLLCLSRSTGAMEHSRISALPGHLRSGDLVVVNDTRVFPARLLGHRLPSGGAVECLLVARVDDPAQPSASQDRMWEALVHPGQKLKPGARVIFQPRVGDAATIHGEILERRYFGRRLVRLWTDDGSSLDAAVDAIGHVPLPPYIKRDDRPSDRERYQTMFAERRGSIAAPTAGLHFTPPLLAALAARGVEVTRLTLHVGYGTFQPVRVERVEEHRIEAERYAIGEATASAVNQARVEGRRVIAVGTTTTRTLEASALANAGRVAAGEGVTDLFIYPGFQFQVVDGLLTNFHLPRSSLLMLVAAFAGRERVLAAYREAVRRGYRFFSYGDAMLIA